MFGKRKKSAAEHERERAEETMAMPPPPAPKPYDHFAAAMARVSVDPLPGGMVSVRMVFPERTVVLTLDNREAMDLAFMVMAAAAGRCGP